MGKFITCPVCKSIEVSPTETSFKEYDEDRGWVQEQDSNDLKLAVSFICALQHVFILTFVYNGNTVDTTVETYSTTEVMGGLGALI